MTTQRLEPRTRLFAGRERPMTADEYERIAPRLDGPSELIDGRLRLLWPASFAHGEVVYRLGRLTSRWLDSFAPQEEPVKGYGAETGFRLPLPRRPVMAPDLAFVRRERLPVQEEGFFRGTPDFAAEVRSPGDTLQEPRDKEEAWIAAGVRLVWSVDPEERTVRVLRPGAPVQTLAGADLLTGEDVLPGWLIMVGELFA